MTVEIMGALLFAFALATALITQGLKNLLDSMKVKYASNMVAAVVSVAVAGAGTSIYYIWNNYEWTSLHIICIFLMMVANWLAAMFGYDKVMQTMTQIAAAFKRK
ncbi:MAG: hypothetical protein J6K15_06370 [Lachnospiraceae bacterium]|nr:hypothetical protein [Lachnospiraceae bacterium]